MALISTEMSFTNQGGETKIRNRFLLSAAPGVTVVLPAPPGPVSVSTLASASRAAASASSFRRPTNRVSGAGRLVVVLVNTVATFGRALSLPHCTGRRSDKSTRYPAGRSTQEVDVVGSATRDAPAMRRALLTTIGVPLLVDASPLWAAISNTLAALKVA